jgi:crotonobetainyl-CoA:carnitine CoA-transferase CaiB-like acyl-CoA transferase
MTMALEGVRVLDSAHQYPGPYCSMLLADLGAEVLKVEEPGIGDPARQLPPFFQSINRNKRSLTLNLKMKKGKRVFYRLIEEYDIFTEGFRPGVAKRLEIDYGTLNEINPRLIYCSISGYGQTGPYRDLPGHDVNYQAMAGMLERFQDKDGEPILPDVAIGDLSSGMFAAIGILASLSARDRTGKGQYIDCSMFDGLLSWMTTHFGHYFATGETRRTRDPGYEIFRTSDNQYLTLGIAHEDWFWDRLCGVLGLDELKGLVAVDRRGKREELVEKIAYVFKKKRMEEWIEILVKADVPVSPVKSLGEVLDDPHVKEREMIQEMTISGGKKTRQVAFPMKLSSTPATFRMPTPALGEHTDEVLAKLGYDDNQIAILRKEGVI